MNYSRIDFFNKTNGLFYKAKDEIIKESGLYSKLFISLLGNTSVEILALMMIFTFSIYILKKFTRYPLLIIILLITKNIIINNYQYSIIIIYLTDIIIFIVGTFCYIKHPLKTTILDLTFDDESDDISDNEFTEDESTEADAYDNNDIFPSQEK